MKIKGNKKLFLEYELLTFGMKSASSIIQDDVNITSKQLEEWTEMMDNIASQVSELKDKTLKYIGDQHES